MYYWFGYWEAVNWICGDFWWACKPAYNIAYIMSRVRWEELWFGVYLVSLVWTKNVLLTSAVSVFSMFVLVEWTNTLLKRISPKQQNDKHISISWPGVYIIAYIVFFFVLCWCNKHLKVCASFPFPVDLFHSITVTMGRKAVHGCLRTIHHHNSPCSSL